MKRIWALLLSCAAVAAAQSGAAAPAPAKAEPAPAVAADSGSPTLAAVQKVYLLPMRNGLDQYLANRITNLGVLQVVTEPGLADAVLADNIGKGFEDRMSQLYPPPKPPQPAPKEKTEDASPAPFPQAEPAAAPASNWGRGRGNIFLIDVKTKRVLWSTYDLPADTSTRSLDRSAVRVIERLQKNIIKAKPKTK